MPSKHQIHAPKYPNNNMNCTKPIYEPRHLKFTIFNKQQMLVSTDAYNL